MADHGYPGRFQRRPESAIRDRPAQLLHAAGHRLPARRQSESVRERPVGGPEIGGDGRGTACPDGRARDGVGRRHRVAGGGPHPRRQPSGRNHGAGRRHRALPGQRGPRDGAGIRARPRPGGRRQGGTHPRSQERRHPGQGCLPRLLERRRRPGLAVDHHRPAQQRARPGHGRRPAPVHKILSGQQYRRPADDRGHHACATSPRPSSRRARR